MLGKWKKQAEEEAREIVETARLAADQIRAEAKDEWEKKAQLLTLREQGLTGRLADLKAREEQMDLQLAELNKREADLAAEWKKYNHDQQELIQKLEELVRQKKDLLERRDNVDALETNLKAREKAVQEAEQDQLRKLAELDQLTLDLQQKKQALDTREKALLAAEKTASTQPTTPATEGEESAGIGPIAGPVASAPNEEEMIDPTLRFRLPNGMVGKQYRQALAELTDGPDPKQVLVIQGLEEYGLSFDRKAGVISGEPTTEGDFELRVTYVGQEQDPTAPDMFFQFLVNPDPRSMWKNLPADPEVPFPKSEDDREVGKLGKWLAVAASRRGRSHAHKGTHRDDHILIESIDDNWLLLAVADGAGSATVSREGSRLACVATAEEIRKRWPAQREAVERGIAELVAGQAGEHQEMHNCFYNVIGGGLYAARNAIKESAEANGLAPRDYYTTLLLAMVRPWEDGLFVCQYAVGDGAVAIHRPNEMVALMNTPDGGEFAGQTRFLNMTETGESQDIWNRIRFRRETTPANLFLLTDGVTDPKFGTDAELENLGSWEALWQEIQPIFGPDATTSASDLLAWLDFWSPGNHDDRSIVVLYQPD